MTERERQLAWGGIIGPVGFVLAWIVWGVVASNYTALDDTISELAASNAPPAAPPAELVRIERAFRS